MPGSSGPLTASAEAVGASSLSVGSEGVVVVLITGPPDHVSNAPASRAPGSISGRLSTTISRRALITWSLFPAAFPPPALASWSSSPARAIGVPHGQPTSPQRAGPWRGFHVSHAQDAIGEGALYSPGTGGAQSRPATITGLHPAHHSAIVPAPRHSLHHCAALFDEPSTRVQAIRPSDLPLARRRWMDQPRLRLSPELRTPPSRATHVGAGTDQLSTDPKSASTASAEPPTSRIYLKRATSRRTRETGSLAPSRWSSGDLPYGLMGIHGALRLTAELKAAA